MSKDLPKDFIAGWESHWRLYLLMHRKAVVQEIYVIVVGDLGAIRRTIRWAMVEGGRLLKPRNQQR